MLAKQVLSVREHSVGQERKVRRVQEMKIDGWRLERFLGKECQVSTSRRSSIFHQRTEADK